MKDAQYRALTGLSLPWHTMHLHLSTAAVFSTVTLALCVPNEVISRLEIYQPSVSCICSSSNGKEISQQTYNEGGGARRSLGHVLVI